MSIIVKQGGMLSTIQDMGRVGYQQYGIPTCGAMDSYSHAIANMLVGNPIETATIETTITGPCIEFTKNTLIAIAGGDFTPHLNGRPLPLYTAHAVKAGDVLDIGTGHCRTYLAVWGGFDLPELLGSHSTYLKVDLGGAFQRGLTAGDRIPLHSCPSEVLTLSGRNLPIPIKKDEPIRVTLGPQQGHFTENGLKTFLQSEYTVGANDRMGYRLCGQKIEHVGDANIISDGIAFGAVQVPQDGQPIIMMADRQTTGGYTKIATVISTDLPRIAQLGQGDKLRFAAVTVEQARDLYAEQRKELQAIARQIATPKYSYKSYRVTVEDKAFEVTIRLEV